MSDERPEITRLQLARRITNAVLMANTSTQADEAVLKLLDELEAALRASPVTECCGVALDESQRYCPKCGWECRLRASQEGREQIKAWAQEMRDAADKNQPAVMQLYLRQGADLLEASAPSEGVLDTKKMQMPLRAEENEMPVNTSSPPQRTAGDSSPIAPEESTCLCGTPSEEGTICIAASCPLHGDGSVYAQQKRDYWASQLSQAREGGAPCDRAGGGDSANDVPTVPHVDR
jgi:hypothetical protein